MTCRRSRLPISPAHGRCRTTLDCRARRSLRAALRSHPRREWRRLGRLGPGPFLYDPGLLRHRVLARRIVAGSPDAFAVIDFPQSFTRLAPDLLATGRFDPPQAVPSRRDVGGGRPATEIPGRPLEGASGTLPGVPLPTRRANIDAFAPFGAATPQAGFDARLRRRHPLLPGRGAASSRTAADIAARIESVSGPRGAASDRLSSRRRSDARRGRDRLPGRLRAARPRQRGDPPHGLGVYRYRGRASSGGTITRR